MEDKLARDIFSVSRLNLEVRNALEGSFPLLWVSGEITNLARPASNHLYFALTDGQTQVRCALFRNKRHLLRIKPENGQQVIVRAKVSFFEPRGEFQLIIEHMELAGEGQLRQQVEALRNKLDGEGLFSHKRKQPIPLFPERIGIVTSASGAAIHDVLTVCKRRCASIPLILYPIPVQGGATAVNEVIESLKVIEQRKEVDLLILTRGGGSLEDLMLFNDESLVRTLATISIPCISAIGHEINVTLCDFVADQRAATPSQAAELATPDREQLIQNLDKLSQGLAQKLGNHLQNLNQNLDLSVLRLQRLHPKEQLKAQGERLRELQRHCQRQVELQLRQSKLLTNQFDRRLKLQSPDRAIRRKNERLKAVSNSLEIAMKSRWEQKHLQLSSSLRMLNAINPFKILQRGYAVVFNSQDQAVTDTAELKPGDRLKILFAKGKAESVVDQVLED